MNRRLFVCDAYESGFTIEPIEDNTPYTDLLLVRPHSDYKTIYDTTLFVTDGYIRKALLSDQGIRLINAYSNTFESVTLIRTNQIGVMHRQDIKATDLFVNQAVDTANAQSLHIITEFNPLTQFYLMVIDGHIYINDNRIYACSDNTIAIDQLSMDIDKKYAVDNGLLCVNKQFYHYDYFKEYLIANGYIIYFKTPLSCTIESLTSHNLPGRYDIDCITNDLLITESGRVLEYCIRGNRIFPIIEGKTLITGHYRCYTTDNEKWATVGETPPYRLRYEDLYKIHLIRTDQSSSA